MSPAERSEVSQLRNRLDEGHRWFYPALLLTVLAALVWPPAGALLVIVGAALTLWKD